MLITPEREYCNYNCLYVQEKEAKIAYYKERYEELQQRATEYQGEILSIQDVPHLKDEQD